MIMALRDTLAVAGRGLLIYRRVPQLLVFSTIQPVVFVLMFRYVFGGAIRVPGVHYVDFLMPGIFAQTVTFGSINTGVGLAQDLGSGLIERFRSLPMARSAVLAGRTVADVVRNIVQRWSEVAVRHQGPAWPSHLSIEPPAPMSAGVRTQIVRTIPPNAKPVARW